MKFFTKKGFFLLIAIFNCIALESSVVNLSSTSLNTSDHSSHPRIAAISNYKLDFNITWGYSGDDVGRDIALDESGNIYISGATDSYGFGLDDTLIGKYDNTGDLKMNLNWGGTGNEQAQAIALNESGDIYITGYTTSFTAGLQDAFIAKYDRFGLFQWRTNYGYSQSDFGHGIAINGSDIFICGDTKNPSTGSFDAFIAKFNSTGHSTKNITWGKQGSSQSDFGRDIAINGSDIFICGQTLSFGLVAEAFVAKINSTGDSTMNITWSKGWNDYAYGITLDDSGNIYITGETNHDSFLFCDPFIAKFNSTGHSTKNITWGADPSKDDYANDIALDNSGNIYITGVTSSFGPFKAFIAKYDSTGHSKTNITWGGPSIDRAHGIALDDSGNIYITGETQSFGAVGYDIFIQKYSPVPALGYVAPDDDDDDDDDTAAEIRLISIIILACIGSGIAVIYILIKTGKIGSSKVKR
jgi:hypothetical protein